MDIAELGFSVNTQAIQAAEKVLDGFVAKARDTQAALNSITGGSRGSSKIVAEASKQATAIDKSTAATKKLVDASDKAADSASRAADSLKRWIDGLQKSNTEFMRTNTQLLKMSEAYANLDAATKRSYETTARLADAYKRNGALLQESLSPLATYKQSLADIAVIEKNGARSEAELATARRNALGAYREALGVSESTQTATQQLATRTRELNAAVKNGAITQGEFTSQIEMARKALLGEATAAERAALAAKQAALAMKEYQSIQSARVVQAVGGLSGGNNLSSAELASMRRDAQIAFGAVETSGTSAMNKIAVSATKTTAEVGALRGAVEGLGNVFKHAFGGLIAFAAVGAIAEFSKSLGEAQVKMQQILFTLSAVSGGMANAKQEFQFVTDISMKLGLNLEESAAGFSRLAASAYGAGLSTADLHKGFTGLSEAFTVLHAPADEVRRVLIQLDQGFSLGKIQMRDLRAISNSMPNVMELVKESFEGTGKSMSSMLAQGGIPAEEFFQRFTALLHDKYGPAAVDAAQGINAELQRLHSTMMLLKTQSGFAEPFTEAIHDLVETLNQADVQTAIKGIVKGMGEGFKNIIGFVSLLIEHIGLLVKAIEALVIIITTRLIAGGLTKLGAAVAQQAALFGVYSIETRALSVSMTAASVSARGLSAAMALVRGTIGIAIIAIGAIGYAIYQETTKVDRMKESFKALTDQMKDTSAIASSTADNLKTALGSFASTDPLIKTTGLKEASASVREAQQGMAQAQADLEKYKAQLTDYQKQLADAIDAQQRLVARGLSGTQTNPVIEELTKEIAALTPQIDNLQSSVDSVNGASAQLANTFQSMLIPQLKEAYHEGSNTGGIMGGIESAWLKLVDTVKNNPLDMFAKAKGDLDKMEDDILARSADFGKTERQKLTEKYEAAKKSREDAGLPLNLDAEDRYTRALMGLDKMDAGLRKHAVKKDPTGLSTKDPTGLSTLINTLTRASAEGDAPTKKYYENLIAIGQAFDKDTAAGMAFNKADKLRQEAALLNLKNYKAEEDQIKKGNALAMAQYNATIQEQIKLLGERSALEAKQPIMGTEAYSRATTRLGFQQEAAQADLEAHQRAATARLVPGADIAQITSVEDNQVKQNAVLLQAKLNDETSKYIELQKNEQDAYGGMKAGLVDWINANRKAADQMRGFTQDAISSMSDAFANFVTTGKANFADLTDSIISELIKIETRILLSQALTSMFGGFDATGGAGAATYNAMGGVTHVDFGGGRASGGPVAGGNLYEVAEGGAPELLTSSGRTYLMMGAQGGQVTPASAAWGGSGAGRPGGEALGGVQVEINITNNGQAVQATQTGSRMDGKKMMIDLILDTVSGDTAKGGRTALATQQRFGLQRRGVPVGA